MTLNGLYLMISAVNLFSIITSTLVASVLTKSFPRDCKTRSATAYVVGPGIRGTFRFVNTKTDDGFTTLVTLEVSGLIDGEAYGYSIHNDPIDKTGNCQSGNGRFNPTNSVLVGKCPAAHRGKCQAGDLSRKFGQLIGNTHVVTQQYMDSSLKISPSQRGILNKSIVIVDSNMNRVACGTILPGKCHNNK